MITLEKYDEIPGIKNDILSALAYYDIFTYPLKKREIWLFLPGIYDHYEFEFALEELLNNCIIYKLGEFYSLQNNYSMIQRRVMGNKLASEMMAMAEKAGAIISKFPYVRGIAISGSLSKNFADGNSDIDLFIITAKNKLWIARSCLHILSKVATLLNRQKFFCMNYFIDEAELEIEEKNIYTATEIITLIPLQGSEVFEKFFAANGWTKKFLPNNYMRVSTAKTMRSTWVKWLIEKMMNNSIGNRLDTLLMNITAKRWNRKTRKKTVNKNGILFSMKTSKHHAKHDPATFQDKIVALHQKRTASLLDQQKIRQMSAN